MITFCQMRKVTLTTGILIMLSLSLSIVPVDAAFMSSTKSTAISTSSYGFKSSTMNQVNSQFMGRGMKLQQASRVQKKAKSNRIGTELGMFLGSDGILGVGAPEIAVTLLVGYFVLGPSDLYKLTKEIGKFIQSFRTLSTEASKSFESTMENQLDLQEMRKAQAELNSAFSFRRSINTDAQGDAFSEIPPMAQPAGEAAAAATATATATGDAGKTTVKKKKKRRRVKKKVAPTTVDEIPAFSGDIPDLDMSQEFKNELMKDQVSTNTDTSANPMKMSDTADEATRLRNERMDRLQNGQPSTPPDWYSASESDIASEVLSQQEQPMGPTPAESAAAESRFANQLSGDWNQQILENEDQLSPLGKVMERLAILEEEKMASDSRLEEEFRLRAENEEKFYRKKRQLLEDASAEIAASVYNFDSDEKKETSSAANGTTSTKTTTTTTTSKDTKA
jgi:Sec-independent protein translocase protein TatA